jgi:predicted PurR-regulated permease PerM
MMPLGKPIKQIPAIGALLLLSIGCAIVLWPFLSALLWAAVICYFTWPIYTWFERTLGGHRGMAAALKGLMLSLARAYRRSWKPLQGKSIKAMAGRVPRRRCKG